MFNLLLWGEVLGHEGGEVEVICLTAHVTRMGYLTGTKMTFTLPVESK